MIQPEVGTKQVKSGIIMRVLVSVLLVLAVLFLALVMYLKSQGIDIREVSVNELIRDSFPFNGIGSNGKTFHEISYELREHPIFATSQNYIIKCTKDSIQWIDQKGNECGTVDVSLSDPFIKKAGNYVLVADMDGRNLYVINGRDKEWEFTMDSSIINADINSMGYVTVVHEEEGYRSAVTAFDLQGQELFTRYFTSCFVLSAKVSPERSHVLVDGIDTSGVTIKASFEFIDMHKGDPVAGKSLEDNNIYPALWFLDDETAVAASTSSILSFTGDKKGVWKTRKYKNSRVLSLNVASGKYIVAAISKNSIARVLNPDKTDVQIMDRKMKDLNSYTVEGEVKSLETYSDVIAANTGREVYFINVRGKLLGKFNSRSDIIDVFFLGRREAAIITKDSVIVAKAG